MNSPAEVNPQLGNPYVGPRPFEPEDRARFFGRNREASEVVSLVIAHRVVLVYAESGAGKSSLINAGIIPRLVEEEGFEVLPSARVRGLIPESLQHQDIANLYVFNSLLSWAGDEADPQGLARSSLADFLREVEHPTDENELAVPRVVIFDQFEELFTFYPERWQDREDFFRQVRSALDEDSLLRVIFVMREDYIAQMDPHAYLFAENLRTRFRLEHMGGEAALAAVTGPLSDTGRAYAEGVAESLIEELLKTQVQVTPDETVEVVGRFVEPVQLQVVCEGLWRELPPDVSIIQQSHVQTFGDVDRALSRFYENAILSALMQTGVNEDDLRQWFHQTLITPAGTRGTMFRGIEETSGIPNAVVDILENLHIIRAEVRAGARWYELTHDRFIEPIRNANREAGWVSPEVRAQQRRRRTRIIRYGSLASVIIMAVVGGLVAFAIDSRADAVGARADAVGAVRIALLEAGSCSDIRNADPSSPDGEYSISRTGLRFNVYCHDMANEPREYLTLSNVGGSSNFSQYTAGGAAEGETVRTHYTKIRINPRNLSVDISDQTFASSVGSITSTNSDTAVTFMRYGVASDCSGEDPPTGLANIDLRGTPFAVDDLFIPQGYLGSGDAVFSLSDQVVSITGGGFCGSNSPTILLNPAVGPADQGSSTGGLNLKQIISMGDTFDDNDLNGWITVDQGTKGGKSQWQATHGKVLQSSNIFGPGADASTNRKGTFIYWSDPDALDWSDYNFSVKINSAGDDGIGVLFRYKDKNNYYKVEFNLKRPDDGPDSFRKLLKVVSGDETTLASVDDGYLQDVPFELSVTVVGDEISVSSDGAEVFKLTDSALNSGTIALYTWGNQGVIFDDVVVTPRYNPPPSSRNETTK